MKIALLWYVDPNSGECLLSEIMRAVEYHEEAYEKKPNCCHVHPDMLDGEISIKGIRIVEDRSIQANHIWIGVEESGTD